MAGTMRALTVNVSPSGLRELRYEQSYPLPQPGAGEVLVKVLLAGICGTDHHILEDFKTIDRQLVLGHEFVGTVDAFGPDCPNHTTTGDAIKLNDRVVAEINVIPAPKDAVKVTVASMASLANRPRTAAERAHDGSRTALGLFGKDGAFADYVVVPFENIHRVPDNVATRVAVFTEPVAAACQILKQVHIKPTDRVAVLGAGKLGWIVAKVLAASAVNVCILTRRSSSSFPEYIRRFGLLNDCDVSIPIFSLFDTVNGGKLPVSETSSSIKRAEQHDQEQPKSFLDAFDIVVDCTGNPKGLNTAIQVVKPHGTIVLKSTCGPNLSCPVDLTPVVIKEVRIVGSRCGPFDAALRLLRNGLLDVDSLITQVFPIESGKLAFAKSREQGVLKVLLEF